MFRYANPYDFKSRVTEGDHVDYMDMVLDVADEFDGRDVESEGLYVVGIVVYVECCGAPANFVKKCL